MQYLLLSILAAFSTVVGYNDIYAQEKILFVTTNVNQMKGQPNGTYLIELAVPFDKFKRAGYEIDIVSPQGGKIPIYHSGDTTDAVKKIILDPDYQRKPDNSLQPKQLDHRDYTAVIIPGGYGQFWDTHGNEDILRIIAGVYEAGGLIGSIGHGTATLIDVKLSSGAYFVEGKSMTSFPSLSERTRMQQSDYGKLLPYDMEVELLKRGADLKVYDPESRTNHEIIDAKNRLVTASFASGGKFVAEELLKLIRERN